MPTTVKRAPWLVVGFVILSCALFGMGCSTASTQDDGIAAENTSGPAEANGDPDQEANGEILTLPELAAAALGGEPLQVVATTSIIGDVVGRVGGDAIALTTLMEPGQDPHSYEPGAQELTAVAEAHVIFVNGWDLEEGLVDDLREIAEETPLVPISVNIKPLVFGESEYKDGQHEQNGADPHVWLSVHNVEQWVANVENVLSALDPANAETYESNAAAYRAALEALQAHAETQLGQIPEENRILVTNHGAIGYFAREYSFSVLGTVIPSMSTLAEPSASDFASLVGKMEEHGVCTIFTETSVSDTLAETVAAELEGCDTVSVLKLYTGSLGPAGSGADSYIGMFRANVDMLVEGLQQK
jgi:zinc/manganese transport system substrate-binding protein